MNLKRWRLGLLVSTIIGFFTACSAAAILDVTLNYKFFLFFIGLIGKDVILFLKDHPVDAIIGLGDTQQFTRADVRGQPPGYPPSLPPDSKP